MRYYILGGANQLEQEPKSEFDTGKLLQDSQRKLRRFKLPSLRKDNEYKTAELANITFENPNDPLVIERNALTIKVIEEIWRNMRRDIQSTTSNLGCIEFISRDENIKPNPWDFFSEMPPADKFDLVSTQEMSDRDMDKFLTNTIGKLFKFHILGYVNKEKEEQKQGSKNAEYERLVELVKQIPNLAQAKDLKIYLEGGTNAAIISIGNLLKIIPILYARQFSKIISKEKYTEIAIESQSLMQHLASCQGQVFRLFRRVTGNPHNLSEFDIDSFKIAEKNGKLRVELSDYALQTIKRSMEKADPKTLDIRTGCPGQYATAGSSKKNVNAEVYDWLQEVYLQYYYPTFIKSYKRFFSVES